MLLLVIVLLVIILLSRVIEQSIKFPKTLSIIIFAFSISFLFPNLFLISHEEFDEILYLMLPMILLPDILNISLKELKEHAKEIFYLAFIAVILSISIATLITPYILVDIQFTTGMLIALFSMLMATDAITVASVMSKFKLPERLKIYAESESLFNDVTALIIFYFIALPLITGGEVTVLSINITLFKVVLLSLIIGIVVSIVGYLFMKILKDPLDQFIIIYLVVIISFLLAEHFHISGILSIVTSVISFKLLVQNESSHKQIPKDLKIDQNSMLELIKKIPAITKREFREYKKEAVFIGIFANAIVFIIIANIIDFESLSLYYKEVLTIFAITTIIRYSAIFSMVKIFKLPTRWLQTLTLAGSKGALAIIMSHSLPDSFIYKDMFIAIVIGNVLLSTLIYTVLLMLHININKKAYEKDILIFNAKESNTDKYVKSLVNIIEKDIDTGAYNKPFIEEIFQHELARSQRYKTNLSVLSFKIIKHNQENTQLQQIGKIIVDTTRTNDYFGKTAEAQYIILASDTSLSGSMILAQKLLSKIDELQDVELIFGLTQANDTDTLESIYEKLEDALERAFSPDGEKVEIEV
ncbi:MAG: cation:proton antiporter [Campylobacterota bacterium]|nr:cation:proton antiporter [Campylobacterota bacterium]